MRQTATLMMPLLPIAGNRLVPIKAQTPPNLFGLGVDEPMAGQKIPPWMKFAYSLMGLGAGGALIYHGYKRNDGSVGWGLVWGLLGGMVWPITLPIAFAQGIGKPKAA